ncbi:MAG: type II toxin-antitoxin system RelE/ParE family toxin [Acidobacteria bacterium]|nr:type II toxin-antitoxin system RelE/ParE family toxin [Acidobacteriota bacterium]
MNFSIHPEAESEFYEAVSYLNEQAEGLGTDFAIEVFSTISRILNHPYAWQPLTEQIRRCLCKRFPYGLIYEIIDDDVNILAIMHLSREPDYWKTRLA